MPAIDICEPAVIRALEKDGWVVTNRPFGIRVNPKEGILADLRLKQRDAPDTIIVIEVKCFSDRRSALDEFYGAVGQYLSYRQALRLAGLTLTLYLSIPAHVYETFFNRELVQAVVQEIAIKLIIVDIESEEVVEWIP